MGTVSTALSEEAFTKCLKKSKYVPASPIAGFSHSDKGDAKCSICQVYLVSHVLQQNAS